MELHRFDIPNSNRIKPHSTGEFLVNDVLYTQSIIVSADNVITDWNPKSVADLTIEDFQMLAEFDPEILILGTGKDLVFPDLNLLQPLVEQMCGYEIMNSRSACSTFNILLGEDRKVIAALITDCQ